MLCENSWEAKIFHLQSAVKSLYANSTVKRALGLFFVSPKCNYTRDKNTICFVVHENRISPIKNKSIPTNDLFSQSSAL